ncbi:MAG: hypothetical protein HY661_01425 [Betaproteobacteria bacterium]|nr:hypothetical protein [Betaproteobacteria bacterium]
MSRKLNIIALAFLSTIAFSQLGNAFEVVNPENSGYLGPVTEDNAYEAKAAASPDTSSFSRFSAVVNPEDSGYLGPVTLDSGYRGQAAATPSTSSLSRFNVVVNPENSGYLGPAAAVTTATGGKSLPR